MDENIGESILSFYDKWDLLGQFRIIEDMKQKSVLLQEYDAHTNMWTDVDIPDIKSLLKVEQEKCTYIDPKGLVKDTMLTYIRNIRYRRARIQRIAHHDDDRHTPYP